MRNYQLVKRLLKLAAETHKVLCSMKHQEKPGYALKFLTPEEREGLKDLKGSDFQGWVK